MMARMLTVSSFIVAAGVLIASCQQWFNSRDEYSAALSLAMSVQRDLETVMTLSQRHQKAELQKRPPQDVIAQINAVMAESGIPTDRFESLSPQGDGLVDQRRSNGPHYRRQSLRLQLKSLSLDEFGRFVVNWQRAQPLWAITSIELNHNQRNQDGSYDVALVLSAVYVSQDGSS